MAVILLLFLANRQWGEKPFIELAIRTFVPGYVAPTQKPAKP